MADHFYTCCEDGMLSRVPPTDRSGLCPACKPRTPAQPLLTDDDWQAIADEADRIVPGKLIAVIQKRIALALARGVKTPDEPNSPAVQKAMGRFYRKRVELLLCDYRHALTDTPMNVEKAQQAYEALMALVDGIGGVNPSRGGEHV